MSKADSKAASLMKAKGSWPVGDRVLIQMREVGVTEGGIHLPTQSGKLETEGVVIAVGPEAKQIKVDDHIIIPGTGVAFEVLIEGFPYVVIKEKDVLVNLGS